MPLSDRERQILSDIEAHLRQEDPKFVRAVGTTTPPPPSRSRLRLAVVGFVVGLLLLFGIVSHIAWGLIGFALMLVSAVYGGNLLAGASRGEGNVLDRLRGLRRYLGAPRPPRERDDR